MRLIGRAIWVVAGFILLGSIVFMSLHVHGVTLHSTPVAGVTTLQQAEVRATENEITHDQHEEPHEEAPHEAHGR